MKIILPSLEDGKYIDAAHPEVLGLALRLTAGQFSERSRLDALVRFVRDQIPFGFPPVWNKAPASATLAYGKGYSVTKSTLLCALCRAAGINARVHFGLIRMDIMRGIFPVWALWLAPRAMIHAWTDVQLNGQWKQIDAYINDQALYQAARRQLRYQRLQRGYSLACTPAYPCHPNWEVGYHHMGAVVTDLGHWEDPADFYDSPYYWPLPRLVRLALPFLLPIVNRRIEELRGASSAL